MTPGERTSTRDACCLPVVLVGCDKRRVSKSVAAVATPSVVSEATRLNRNEILSGADQYLAPPAKSYPKSRSLLAQG